MAPGRPYIGREPFHQSSLFLFHQNKIFDVKVNSIADTLLEDNKNLNVIFSNMSKNHQTLMI